MIDTPHITQSVAQLTAVHPHDHSARRNPNVMGPGIGELMTPSPPRHCSRRPLVQPSSKNGPRDLRFRNRCPRNPTRRRNRPCATRQRAGPKSRPKQSIRVRTKVSRSMGRIPTPG